MVSRCAIVLAGVAVPCARTVGGLINSAIGRLRVHSAGFCLLSITIVLADFPSLAETPQPVHWTVFASCRDCSRIRKDAAIVAHLHATMKPGWHIYALEQGPGGPVPMRISLPQQQPFVVNGDIDAPTSKTAFDPNLGIEVRFYENKAAFILQLKSGSRNPSESSKIFVDVLYQACTQQMCMPPKVAHLSAAVSR